MNTIISIGSTDFVGTADQCYEVYKALTALTQVNSEYDWGAKSKQARQYYYRPSADARRVVKIEDVCVGEFGVYSSKEKAEAAIERAVAQRDEVTEEA